MYLYYMLFKTNYRAALRSLNPRYIWIGWVTLLFTIVSGFMATYLYLQLANLLNAFFSKLTGDEKAVYIVVALGSLFVAFIAFLFFSSVFIKADTFFWKDKVDKLIIKISNAFFTVLQLLVYLAGVAAIAWVLGVALVSRFTDSDSNTILFSVILSGLLFSPFLLRLWFLPATAAVLSGTPNNPWVIIVGAMRKKTAAIALAVACQALFLIIILAIAKVLELNFLAQAYFQLLSGGQDLEQALSSSNQYLQEINYLNIGLFILLSGPLLAIAANMIVSTIRVLIGVDNGDRPEIHYNAVQAEDFDFKVAPEVVEKQVVYNPGGDKIELKDIPEAKSSDAVDPFKDLHGNKQDDELIEKDIFDGVIDENYQEEGDSSFQEPVQPAPSASNPGPEPLPQPLPPVPVDRGFKPNPQPREGLNPISPEQQGSQNSITPQAQSAFDVNKIAEDVQQKVSQENIKLPPQSNSQQSPQPPSSPQKRNPGQSAPSSIPANPIPSEIPDLPDLNNIPRPRKKQ
jgi:hypothetical protein